MLQLKSELLLLQCRSSQYTLINNHGKTLQQSAAEAALIVASTDNHPTSKSPVSLYDLRDALQVNHSRICDKVVAGFQ